MMAVAALRINSFFEPCYPSGLRSSPAALLAWVPPGRCPVQDNPAPCAPFRSFARSLKRDPHFCYLEYNFLTSSLSHFAGKTYILICNQSSNYFTAAQ